MNILTRNIKLTEKMEESIRDMLDFADEFSPKESSLSLTNTKNEFEFLFSFNVEEKCCTVKIKDVDLKRGLQKVRHKSYQKVMSIVSKPISRDTIRKMKPVEENDKEESNVSYTELESLDKPVTEKDAQEIMIEKRLNDVMFINMDADDCLSIMHREKDKFKIYLTDIEIH